MLAQTHTRHPVAFYMFTNIHNRTILMVTTLFAKDMDTTIMDALNDIPDDTDTPWQTKHFTPGHAIYLGSMAIHIPSHIFHQLRQTALPQIQHHPPITTLHCMERSSCSKICDGVFVFSATCTPEQYILCSMIYLGYERALQHLHCSAHCQATLCNSMMSAIAV